MSELFERLKRYDARNPEYYLNESDGDVYYETSNLIVALLLNEDVKKVHFEGVDGRTILDFTHNEDKEAFFHLLYEGDNVIDMKLDGGDLCHVKVDTNAPELRRDRPKLFLELLAANIKVVTACLSARNKEPIPFQGTYRIIYY